MATPTTIPVTPGTGILLDAVSVVVSAQNVVRETMVLADATSPTELAAVMGGALSVFLTSAQIATLTPPTAASIAAAIVANPPTVGISGTVPISGTIAATQSGTWNIGSITTLPAITIAAAQTIAVTQSTASALNATVVGTGTFAVQASITTLGQQLAAASVPVVLTAAQITALTPLTTVSVTQGTSPWVVSQSGNWTTRIVGNAGATLDGTAGTPSTGVLTVQGSTAAGFPLNIAGASGAFLDQASGSAKQTNSLQVGGNDGTNQYAMPLASGGSSVVVSIASAQKIEIYDGTHTATVKAASTAALASDTALVVTTNGSTTAGSPANTSVTSASSSVLASNVARREAIIVNTDVVTVYIGLGQVPTATAYHVALKACTAAHDGTGGSFVTDTWKGAINAIVASTSGHVSITELT